MHENCHKNLNKIFSKSDRKLRTLYILEKTFVEGNLQQNKARENTSHQICHKKRLSKITHLVVEDDLLKSVKKWSKYKNTEMKI